MERRTLFSIASGSPRSEYNVPLVRHQARRSPLGQAYGRETHQRHARLEPQSLWPTIPGWKADPAFEQWGHRRCDGPGNGDGAWMAHAGHRAGGRGGDRDVPDRRQHPHPGILPAQQAPPALERLGAAVDSARLPRRNVGAAGRPGRGTGGQAELGAQPEVRWTGARTALPQQMDEVFLLLFLQKKKGLLASGGDGGSKRGSFTSFRMTGG